LVEQAIGNVVANAIVHTATDARVVIDAGNTSDAIALRVTDNGPGIPPDDLPHIFEKFVKGKELQVLSSDGSHTGLGLAIAKGIMEAHGGAISAESPVADGRGARFILTFPRNGGAP
jgi:two-component system sensor histidine kinase KdpD